MNLNVINNPPNRFTIEEKDDDFSVNPVYKSSK